MSKTPFLDLLDIDGFLPAAARPLHARISHLSDARRRSLASVQRLLVHAASMRALYEAMPRIQTPSAELLGMCTRHAREQRSLIALLDERVRTLGGDGVVAREGAVARDNLLDDTRGLRRIVESHGFGLSESEGMWRQANLDGDDVTCELIADEVVRTNERQRWLAAEHMVGRASVGVLRQRGVTVCRSHARVS